MKLKRRKRKKKQNAPSESWCKCQKWKLIYGSSWSNVTVWRQLHLHLLGRDWLHSSHQGLAPESRQEFGREKAIRFLLTFHRRLDFPTLFFWGDRVSLSFSQGWERNALMLPPVATRSSSLYSLPAPRFCPLLFVLFRSPSASLRLTNTPDHRPNHTHSSHSVAAMGSISDPPLLTNFAQLLRRWRTNPSSSPIKNVNMVLCLICYLHADL